MRDHGGNLDWARAKWGGTDWIDLSTGINRVPFPVPPLTPEAFTALPTRTAMNGLIAAARHAYATQAPMVALAGAQAAIQMIPHLRAPGLARVLGPTYNEHAACLRAAGWQVQEVTEPSNLPGADLAIVVNPNNPGGQTFDADQLFSILPQVGRMIVDESFADGTPLSIAHSDAPGLITLRSFGKFYGLAGLRLGFAIGNAPDIAKLSEMAGPWPVSGPAIEIATGALTDTEWAQTTITRLQADAAQTDAIASKAGWTLEGGTALFRLYNTPNAHEAQETLARHQIWSRIFPYSASWLRLGLPGNAAEFTRLSNAVARQP